MAGVRQNTWLYYAFGFLMELAVAARALGYYFSRGRDLRWAATSVLGAFIVFYLTERWVSSRFPFYLHIYLAIQTALTLTLLLMPPRLFYAAALGLVITAQAVMLLPRRQAYAWIAVFTLITNIGLVVGYGWLDGLSLGFLYIVGYLFTGAYAHMITRASASDERSRALLMDLQQANDRLKLVTEQAQAVAVVEERQRLARDLHDSVVQSLYGLVLSAEAGSRQLGAGQIGLAAAMLRDIRHSAQSALREMRLLIFELRPPDLEKDGLVAALRARLESVEGRAGIRTEFTIEGDLQLSRKVEDVLYRFAQEALNNALRHADADKVAVALRGCQDSVALEIVDDGVGFDVESVRNEGGLGLLGMQERADELKGKLIVESRPQEGTRIALEVPQ
jgi:signal transduction histidine kinase